MTKAPVPMPAESSDRAWKFLARVARERREFIGLSQEELAEYGGPGKSTVGKIERAAQHSYPARTQQQLEKALGWSRGTFREVLAMADADYFDEQEESIAADLIEDELPDLTKREGGRTAADLTDDELLAELTYRMRLYAREKVGSSHGTAPEKMDGGLPAGVTRHKAQGVSQSPARRPGSP